MMKAIQKAAEYIMPEGETLHDSHANAWTKLNFIFK